MTHTEDLHNARQWGGYASKGDAQKRLEGARAELATWVDTVTERQRLADEMQTARALAYVAIAELRVSQLREIVRLYEEAVNL